MSTKINLVMSREIIATK